MERSCKQMKLTKNYGTMCREAIKQKKYRYYDRYPQGAKAVTCVICQKAQCTHAFFPCHHLCACKDCIVQYNIGFEDKQDKPAWRACPLCNEPFKQMLPHTGQEGKKYWDWVHEVKPPLPHDFRQRLIPANMLLAQHAVVQKVQEEPEKEDDPEAPPPGPEEEFMDEVEEVVVKRRGRKACAIM
eukprot:g1594.t1